jgi:hypothetical protein
VIKALAELYGDCAIIGHATTEAGRLRLLAMFVMDERQSRDAGFVRGAQDHPAKHLRADPPMRASARALPAVITPRHRPEAISE